MENELNLGVEMAGADVRDIFDAISANVELVVGAEANVADKPVVQLTNGFQEVRGFLFCTYQQNGCSEQPNESGSAVGPPHPATFLPDNCHWNCR